VLFTVDGQTVNVVRVRHATQDQLGVVRADEAGKAAPVEPTVRDGGAVFLAEPGATYRLSYR
jgi:hypothetical protein